MFLQIRSVPPPFLHRLAAKIARPYDDALRLELRSGFMQRRGCCRGCICVCLHPIHQTRFEIAPKSPHLKDSGPSPEFSHWKFHSSFVHHQCQHSLSHYAHWYRRLLPFTCLVNCQRPASNLFLWNKASQTQLYLTFIPSSNLHPLFSLTSVCLVLQL